MSMAEGSSAGDNADQASPSVIALVEDFCTFWRPGPPRRISIALESFSGVDGDEPTRCRLLLELIKVDIEQHWRAWKRNHRGVPPSGDEAPTVTHPPPLEEYVRELCPLSLSDESLRDLLIHEYRLRQRWGDQPEIEEYVDRFRSLEVSARRSFRSELVAESSVLSLFSDFNSAAILSDEVAAVDEKRDPDVPEDASAPEPLRRVLSRVFPFAELPVAVREALAMHATVHEFAVGDVLLRQGEIADSLLVIVEGSVEITLLDHGVSHRIARLEKETVVGEIGMLTQEHRSANVIAITPGRVATITREKLEHIAGRHPRLALALSELVAERIGTRTIDALYGKRVREYRIGHRLGRGGMGIVYSATQISNGRQLALKMLRHDLVFDRASSERFRQEAGIVKSLHHPHIVRMFDEFPAYGTYFIALELCPGISLYELIERGGPLPDDTVRGIVGQLAGALACAHGAGVAHRDVKPSNVLVLRDGIVKLTDFGLARWSLEDGSTHSISGEIVGTPQYMAPEQFLGDRGDAKSDLYSLGVVIYELITGQRQLQSTRLRDVARERHAWALPAADAIRKDLDQELYCMLRYCLADEPESRTVSLSDLAGWAAPIDWSTVSGTVWPDDSPRPATPAMPENSPHS